MAKSIKISATIICYNEENNIAACIESLQSVADEIVILDSFSEDRTPEICKTYDVRFFQHEFDGHIQQKNRAVEYARHDWILSLDADERLDEELKKNIIALKKDPKHQAYQFNRLNNYCGQWIKHGAWYPDRKVRLWNKSIGVWGGRNPHDKIILTSGIKAKRISGNILHYSFSNVEEHLKQIELFTDISSKAMYEEGRKGHWIQLLINPTVSFVRDYILRLGFLDGSKGFGIAKRIAWSKYLKYQKLIKLNRPAGN